MAASCSTSALNPALVSAVDAAVAPLVKRQTGSEIYIDCQYPGHDDDSGHMSVNTDNHTFYCHGTCNLGGGYVDLAGLLGVSVPLPSNGTSKKHYTGPKIYYSYANGIRKVRQPIIDKDGNPDKEMWQQHQDDNGQWVNGRDGRKPGLFHDTEAFSGPIDEPVFILNGEKAVLRAEQAGLHGTCGAGGEGQWDPTDNERFRGRKVITVADNDPVGIRHADDVAANLYGIADVVKVLRPVETFSNLMAKGDLYDILEMGITGDMILMLVAAAPEWTPPAPTSAASSTPMHSPPTWPAPMGAAAFHGLAGDVVRLIEPHTEADPAALLVNVLAFYGNAVGRGVYAMAEADHHYLNLFAAHVGDTGKGRKGTSMGRVTRLFEAADPVWVRDRIASGLSSGEGLIYHVRDAVLRGIEVIDPGVDDKRLMIIESEFGGTLKVMSREGNTLSAVVRLAWDRGTLGMLTKNAPAKATDAHISIIGHVTKTELLRYLSETESGNGFANRILWVCTKRSKCLPEGGGDIDFGDLVRQLHVSLDRARTLGLLRRDTEARDAWALVYPELSEGRPGLFGAVTGRAEAQVLRLSALYAAIDGSSEIRLAHLKAALAVWEFCENSARYIFGDALGDPIADQILVKLRTASGGCTKTEISKELGRHATAAAIDQALSALSGQGLATCEMEQTAGRSIERWTAV